MPEQTTAIRFPDNRNFHDFREWIDLHYRANEATVKRREVRGKGVTIAILTTFDFTAGDHAALAAVAFRRHAGVIL